jgi:adenylyltransferase/sulfurtransferase
MLSNEEHTRYARHILLPEIGVEGQQKLKNSSALVVGAGGLGSPVALYLAAAGVGRLGVVDNDVVDVSNLQRQILHHTDDVGLSKVDSAQRTLHRINPHVQTECHYTTLNSSNAQAIVQRYDVVVNCTDNFPTRYLLNDVCLLLQKPLVEGSIYRFEGHVMVIDARRADSPCYRCLYPAPPPTEAVPSCADSGVLGVLPGIIGSLQATEALKLLLGIGQSLCGRLLVFNALSMQCSDIRLRKRQACTRSNSSTEPSATPHCVVVTGLIDYDEFCSGSKNNTQHDNRVNDNRVNDSMNYTIGVQDLAELFNSTTDLVLIDVREAWEYAQTHIEGSMLAPLSTLAKHLADRQSDLYQTLAAAASKNRPIVLYCAAGSRSAQALAMMHQHGFLDNVFHLAGGIQAWQSHNL